MRRLRPGLIAILVASMSSTTVAASDHVGQVTLGGLPVPGATISATQGDRHVVAVSDPQGVYRFAGLADGTWTLVVEMLGFSSMTREIAVPSDAPAVWAIAIAPFHEVERIATVPPAAHKATPSRSAAGAQTGATSAGFHRAEVNAAPAARMTADDREPPGDETENRMAAADGLLVNGSVNNGAASAFAQPAAFGNNRSGRRSPWNGAVGVLFGTSAWDARPFSFTTSPARKPSYADWQFLGTLGGPLRIPGLLRKGTTFFVGVQHTDDHNASTHSAILPSALERRGDFSRSLDRFGRPAVILDPETGLPFPGNAIPSDRMSPQAAALLHYYPSPNLDDDRFNYQAPILVVSRRTNVQSRFTHAVNARNQLFATLNYQDGTADTGNVFGFTDSARIAGLEAAINWTHRFTPFLSLRLHYQFTRLSTEVTPYFAGRTNVSGEAGITGTDQEPENWGPPALLFSSGVAGFSNPQYALNQDRTHVWAAESVWTRGRHGVTFGGGIHQLDFDVRSQQDARGTFSFAGAVTGSDLADFLLGIPQSSSIASGNSQKRLRGPAYEVYLNDDWRLSPTVTVTAGLRWEYEAPLTERANRLVNLDVAPGFTAAAPVIAGSGPGPLTGRRYPDALLHSDMRGVQPRFGFGWRPISGSSLIVRGGYGVYRNTNVYKSLALLMAQQPPFSFTVSAENSAAMSLTLANGFPAVATTILATFAIDPGFRVGYAQNWQLSIQRDLPASLAVTATYLGVKGSHLMQEIVPNTYPAGATPPCPACPVGFVYLRSDGGSLRHAVQGQLRRRLRNGLSASVQYTLSKAIDDAGAFTGAALSGVAIAQDWLNPDAERGPSNFDQRHVTTAQFAYTTGVGVAGGGLLTGWKGRLLNGWTLASQLAAGSGLPLTPVYLTSVSGTGVTGTIRASVNRSPGEPPAGFYFDPAAFAAPAFGQWGNARRNSLRGPAQFNLNAGIARTFTFGTRLNLDWRVDATNILNRVTYTGVNALVGSSQFGLPNRANPMRTLRSSLRLKF